MIVPLLMTLLATVGPSPGPGAPPPAGAQGAIQYSLGPLGSQLFTGFS